MSSGSNESSASTTVGRLVITLLGFAIIAIPLAGYTWEVISDLISGHMTARRTIIGIPVLGALILVLRLAARTLVKLDSGFGSRTMQ
jgi:hypothetical protein